MTTRSKAAWIYGARGYDQLAERYNAWATEYDQELTADFGYEGPRRTVEVFRRYVSPTARILDAGAGTGLVGQLLHHHGYRNLVGIDLAAGMLAQAQEKGVYNELHQKVLGEPLDFPTDSFDAVISVGVFAPAQGPSRAFSELIRVTRPNGFIVFTLRPDYYETSDFKITQSALEQSGTWQQIERTAAFLALPKVEPDLYYHVWVYRVCP